MPELDYDTYGIRPSVGGPASMNKFMVPEDTPESGRPFFSLSDVPRAIGAGIEGFAKSTYNLVDKVTGDFLPDWNNRFIDRPQSVAGSLIEGITQFGAGFALGGIGALGKGFQALGALAGEGGTAATVASLSRMAFADAVAFDGHDGRLSNLVQSVPELRNPITDFLAAGPDDGELLGRVKNVVEGLITNPIGEGIAKTLGASLRGVKRGARAMRIALDSGLKADIAAEYARRAAYEPGTVNEAVSGILGDEAAPAVVDRKPVVKEPDPKLNEETFGAEATATNEFKPAEAASTPEGVPTDTKPEGSGIVETINKRIDEATQAVNEGTMTKAEADAVVPTIEPEDKAVVDTFIQRVGKRLFDNIKLVLGDIPEKAGVYGDYNFATDLIRVTNKAIQDGQFSDTLLHEVWHAFEKRLTPENAVLLRREFMAERDGVVRAGGVVGNAVAEGKVLTVAEQVAKGVDRPTALRNASLTYRYTNLQEWWAESMKDRTLAEIAPGIARKQGISTGILQAGKTWLAETARAFASKFGIRESDMLFKEFMSGRMERVGLNLPGGIGRDAKAFKPDLSGESPDLKTVKNFIDEQAKVIQDAAPIAEGAVNPDGTQATVRDVLRDRELAAEVIQKLDYLPVPAAYAPDGSIDIIRTIEKVDASLHNSELSKLPSAKPEVMLPQLVDTIKELSASLGGTFGNEIDVAAKLAAQSPELGRKFAATLLVAKAVMVQSATKAAEVIRTFKPKVLDGTISNEELAVALTLINRTRGATINARKAVLMQSRTFASGKIPVGAKTAGEILDAIKAGREVRAARANGAGGTGELNFDAPSSATAPETVPAASGGTTAAATKAAAPDAAASLPKAATPSAAPGELNFDAQGGEALKATKPTEKAAPPTKEELKAARLKAKQEADMAAFDEARKAADAANVQTEGGGGMSPEAIAAEREARLNEANAAADATGVQTEGGTGTPAADLAATREASDARARAAGIDPNAPGIYADHNPKLTGEDAVRQAELIKARGQDRNVSETLRQQMDAMGIRPEDVADIVNRFGGRKRALGVLRALGAVEDSGKMAGILTKLSSKNADLLREAGGDVGVFLKMLDKEAGHRGMVDILNEIFINGLLSGPKTIVTNAFSGLNTFLWRPLELTLRGGAAALKSGTMAPLYEPLLYLTKMIGDVGDAARIAWASFKSEEPTLLGKATRSVEGIRDSALSASGRGQEGTKIGSYLDAVGRVVRLPSNILQASDEFWKQLDYRAELRVQLFRNGIESGKSVAEAAAYATENATRLAARGEAMSYSKVFNDVKSEFRDNPRYQGLDEAQLNSVSHSEAARRVEKMKADGTWKASENALNWTEEATFTKPLAKEMGDNGLGGAVDVVGRHVQEVLTQIPILRLLIPFVRTPINILKFGASRLDALGAAKFTLSKAIQLGERFAGNPNAEMRLVTGRFMKEITAGGAQAGEAMTRLAVGTGLVATVLASAGSGDITGSGPKDKNQRATLMAAGWLPYSIKIGGQYVSYAHVEPLATILGIAADLVDTHANAHPADQESEADAHGIVSGIITAVTNNLTKKSYLMGLSGVINALQDPEAKGTLVLNKIAASFFAPSLLNQTTTPFDPAMREIRGMVDEWRSRTWMSDSLPASRDVLGAVIKRRQSLGGGISPVFSSFVPADAAEVSQDPVRLEMARLRHGFAPPKPEYAGIDLRDIKGSDGKSAYEHWMMNHQDIQLGGVGLEAALRKLVTSRKYQEASDFVGEGLDSPKVAAINEIINKYRRAAFDKTAKEIPELGTAFNTIRKARIAGRI